MILIGCTRPGATLEEVEPVMLRIAERLEQVPEVRTLCSAREDGRWLNGRVVPVDSVVGELGELAALVDGGPVECVHRREGFVMYQTGSWLDSERGFVRLGASPLLHEGYVVEAVPGHEGWFAYSVDW